MENWYSNYECAITQCYTMETTRNRRQPGSEDTRGNKTQHGLISENSLNLVKRSSYLAPTDRFKLIYDSIHYFYVVL
jgi:hypothetical protein